MRRDFSLLHSSALNRLCESVATTTSTKKTTEDAKEKPEISRRPGRLGYDGKGWKYDGREGRGRDCGGGNNGRGWIYDVGEGRGEIVGLGLMEEGGNT